MMDGTDRWMDRQVDRQINDHTNEWTDRWVDGQMEEPTIKMDGQIDNLTIE
jgi:hypothetical protein